MDKWSETLIRHAYEEVVTYGARLSSFATGRPARTDGPINERQEMLAADDLASFCYHARRLMDLTATKARFKAVQLLIIEEKQRKLRSICRIIDVVIHHDTMEIIRTDLRAALFSSKGDPFEALMTVDPDASFSPKVALKSDKSKLITFDLNNFIEIFQKNILCAIIRVGEESGIYLEDY